jgi:hypothetical protein
VKRETRGAAGCSGLFGLSRYLIEPNTPDKPELNGNLD